jgi:hypothetical protein
MNYYKFRIRLQHREFFLLSVPLCWCLSTFRIRILCEFFGWNFKSKPSGVPGPPINFYHFLLPQVQSVL